jgi:hypothetical protein
VSGLPRVLGHRTSFTFLPACSAVHRGWSHRDFCDITCRGISKITRVSEQSEPKPFKRGPGAKTGREADSASATSPASPEWSSQPIETAYGPPPMAEPPTTPTAPPPRHQAAPRSSGGVPVHGPADPVDSTKKGARRPANLLFIFPILLGVFICALNILVAVRYWPVFRWTAVFPTLITISLFVGLFLIVYAIVLWRFEPGQAPWYAKWVIVPLLVALPASAATVWGARIVEPTVPAKPCIELYQEALNIHKDSPSFRMPSWELDQSRCHINDTLGFPP